MINPKTLEHLVGRIGDALPPGLGVLREDLEKNLRATVSAAIARANLVAREEFDVQAGVLARTREKLEALEVRVAELEQQIRQPPGIGDGEENP